MIVASWHRGKSSAGLGNRHENAMLLATNFNGLMLDCRGGDGEG